MNKIGNQFTSIQQVAAQFLEKKDNTRTKETGNVSFEEVLKQKQDVSASDTLKFSKHAAMRLENRNINLTEEQKKVFVGPSQICTMNHQQMYIIEGDPLNFKITTDGDLLILKSIISK